VPPTRKTDKRKILQLLVTLDLPGTVPPVDNRKMFCGRAIYHERDFICPGSYDFLDRRRMRHSQQEEGVPDEDRLIGKSILTE
jgi:hypothetical protein